MYTLKERVYQILCLRCQHPLDAHEVRADGTRGRCHYGQQGAVIECMEDCMEFTYPSLPADIPLNEALQLAVGAYLNMDPDSFSVQAEEYGEGDLPEITVTLRIKGKRQGLSTWVEKYFPWTNLPVRPEPEHLISTLSSVEDPPF